MTPPTTTNLQFSTPVEELPSKAYWDAMDAIAKVLAVRHLALVATIIAGVLAWRMEADPNWYKIGLLVTYCAGAALAVLFASKD